MKIQRYEHNDEKKRELFGWIGEACASIAIRNHLGNAISSKPGDVWLLAIEGDQLLGFCSVSPLKSQSAGNLHALYAFPDSKEQAVESKLRKAAVAEAKKMELEAIRITDFRKLKPFYTKDGWKAVGDRGQNYHVYEVVVD